MLLLKPHYLHWGKEVAPFLLGESISIIKTIIYIMVAWGGIEPPTQGFSFLCSTDWATKPNGCWSKIRTYA